SPEDLSQGTVPGLIQLTPPQGPPPQPPKEKPPTAAEHILGCEPGSPSTLTVPVGGPPHLLHQHGEPYTNLVRTAHKRGLQNTQPVEHAPAEPPTKWQVSEGADGIGETLRHHVFLLADTAGLTTGLTITTTMRTYLLTCKSAARSPIRTVRWRYPVDPAV